MNCTQIQDYIDTIAGSSKDGLPADVQAHIDGCSQCAAALGKAVQIERLLAGERGIDEAIEPFPVDAEALRTLRRTMNRIDEKQQRRHRLFNLGLGAGAGFALAAGLFVAIFGSALLEIPVDGSMKPSTGVRIALHQKRTINLMFDSPEHVDMATITISLPDNIRIAGYEDRSELKWNTTLKMGKNTLGLPLVATAHGKGILRSELSIGGRSKQFTVQIDVGPHSIDTSALQTGKA